MTNNDLLTCYTFLGNNVKMSALSDKETRAGFVQFFRELRKIALPILEDLKAVEEKPFDDAESMKETKLQILGEDYEGDCPKVKEDILIESLAESGSEIPIIAILDAFAAFTE